MTLQFRAECRADVVPVVKLFLPKQIERVSIVRRFPFPDVCVELVLREPCGLTLKGIMMLIRKIPDSHVIFETIQPKGLFDGLRIYGRTL